MTTTTKHLIATLTLAATLTACGAGAATTSDSKSSSSSVSTLKCSAVYDGKHHLTETEKGSCVLADGSLFISAYFDYTCVDGSTLGWMDAGWWHNGIGYPHLTGIKTAPQAEQDKCHPMP